jgi:hypothetical protein
VDPSNVHARLLETRFTLAAGGDQIREVSAGEAGEGPALAAVLVSGSESGESHYLWAGGGELGEGRAWRLRRGRRCFCSGDGRSPRPRCRSIGGRGARGVNAAGRQGRPIAGDKENGGQAAVSEEDWEGGVSGKE